MHLTHIYSLQEKLRLSKEKREHEKFRNTLLCPNCRHPTRQAMQNMNNMQQGNDRWGTSNANEQHAAR